MIVHQLRNPRSREYGTDLNEYDVQLMKPCRFSLIDQESIRRKEFARFCRTRKKIFSGDISRLRYRTVTAREYRRIFAQPANAGTRDVPNQEITPYRPHKLTIAESWNGIPVLSSCPTVDPFVDNFVSMRNLLCSLYSQSEALEMYHAHADEYNVTYDAVLVMRPDMAYTVDIDLPTTLPVLQARVAEGQKILYVADFHHWAGLNDRFAYGTPDAMDIYLARGNDYIHQSGIRLDKGEIFLYKYLKAKKVEARMSSMLAVRVRMGGRVEASDITLLEEWSDDQKLLINCVNQNNSKILSETC
jgi:hypothetical protein